MLSSLFGSIALAYLLGSIPFGLLLTRAFGMDIRKVGSGNIGATNVMRTGNKFLGFAVLLLDAAKGFLSVWLVQALYYDSLAPIAGLFAILGHIFPFWLRFKGGKGVATTLGVFFALNPVLGGAVCILWLGVFLITRMSSLSSLMAVGYSAIIAYLIADYVIALLCLNLAALIIFTHRGNIMRLLSGTEHRFQRGAS